MEKWNLFFEEALYCFNYFSFGVIVIGVTVLKDDGVVDLQEQADGKVCTPDA